MTVKPRRVVAGQTADDRHIFTHDEEVMPLEMGGGIKWYGMWGWDELPRLPFAAPGGYEARSVFPAAGGLRINTVTFPVGFGVKGVELPTIAPDPRYQKLQAAVTSGGEHDFDVGMHSTDSVDLGFVFSGEITLIQGDGTEATLHPGDVMVQNGSKHAWENRGSDACVICFVVLGTDRALSAQA